MFTPRLKKDHRTSLVLLLLAALLITYSSPGQPLMAQDGQQTSTPLRRMRRAKGEQPRTPSPPAQTKASTPTASTDEDEVVRVDTELVNILLTALDKEQRFITTLRREDIRVLEDKVPQEISIFERETELPLTLAILIDTSRSQEKVMPDEKIAARTFIDSIVRPDKDQVSVISFTGEATLQQALTNDPEQLRAAVERVRVETPFGDPRCEGNISTERNPECWTGVWDAIWVTTNEILSQTPENARRAIILLSDGDDTSSTTKRQEAIDLAVKNNVVVYSIGIHDYTQVDSDSILDDSALRKVSEKTGGRAFFPTNKRELESSFAQIQQELRSQYLVAYTPANKRREGSFRQVKIEVVNPELKKQKLRLIYRQGYYEKRG